jgi:hypothetical protein
MIFRPQSWVFLVIVLAALAAGIYFLFLRDEGGDSIEESPGEVEIKAETVSHEDSAGEYRLRYPRIAEGAEESAASEFNRRVEQWIQEQEEWFKRFVAEIPELPEDAPPREVPNSLTIDYDVVSESPRFVSVLMSVSYYTGGAHGNQTAHAINFDLQQQRELELSHLFESERYLQRLSAVAREKLILAFNEEFGEIDEFMDDQIRQGTEPLPEHFLEFVVSSEGLTFIFDPYEVAAYAAGPQEVTIAFNELTGDLAPSPYLRALIATL